MLHIYSVIEAMQHLGLEYAIYLMTYLPYPDTNEFRNRLIVEFAF